VISAFNEDRTIRTKIENSVALDYPPDRLEVLVVSDASTDNTDRIVEEYKGRGVTLLRLSERRGKTVGLNAAMQVARGEIVVFSDANILYHQDALRHLVSNFADPAVGCVTGNSCYIDQSHSAAHRQENTYWGYERFVRTLESQVGSTVGGDGAIFAIRRELYTPLPPEAINDLVTPLQIVVRGYRAVFEPKAVGFEPSAGDFVGEFRRKHRIVNRSWWGVMSVPGVLNPWRAGLFAWQMWSHKVLRWLALPLVIIAAAGCFMAFPLGWEYQLGAWGFTASLIAAGFGALVSRRSGRAARLLQAILYFYLVNCAAILGIARAVTGRVEVLWTPERKGRNQSLGAPLSPQATRMTILYLAHRIPYPPNKGEKIRAFHQIRYLARQHRVHLACLADEKEDLRYIKELEKYCASVDAVYRKRTVAKLLAALALCTSTPLSVAFFASRKLKNQVAQKLKSEQVDRIFVSSVAMAQYVRWESGIARIIDFVDVDSEKWRLYADRHAFPYSWIYRLEASRLAAYEEEIAKVFDCSILVSKKEVDLLQRCVKERPISFIGNGVDINYFSHTGVSDNKQPLIVFTGVMDYFPNVDAVRYFCNEIFPLIRDILPAAEFSIVGRNPMWQVQRLGRQPQVTVTGSVPDVRPYLARAMIAVVPLRIAGGIQNKVLEAMAMGLPVVGTSKAFQGIQATGANGICVADDPRKFAQEVLSLLQDPERRYRCALQARRYVERYHRWEEYGASLDHLLQQVEGESLSQTPSLMRASARF
jgi:sugar transferase (PEP-CTERM/EpsH1 system associated)